MTPQIWLITGGAGYIGAHVADAFLWNGKEVNKLLYISNLVPTKFLNSANVLLMILYLITDFKNKSASGLKLHQNGGKSKIGKGKYKFT